MSERVQDTVSEIIHFVKGAGDRAILELTERLDQVRLDTSVVSPEEWQHAEQALDPPVRQALAEMARRIEAVHEVQRFQESPVDVAPGIRVWREWRPFGRVGLYVPGGRTVYPSSVLMLAIPARLAGCQEIVMCSPPQRNGEVAPAILAAAGIAGVTEVHAIGGAQAIGAMAYGTESIRRVDKIFGPGNAYVTAAKLAIFGEAAVDMPAGPSEILILTDGSLPATWVAADLRAQAEHAPDARAVLVSTDPAVAADVRGLVGGVLAGQVQVLSATEMETAVAFANDFAPEHLTLACAEPDRWLTRISAAGSVFLGPYAAAAAGDYATGANHVLPTGGASRSFSALGVDAFGRSMQGQSLDHDGLRRLEPVVDAIAGAEHLPAHKESVRVRRTGAASFPALDGPRARGAILQMQPYEWEPPSARIASEAGVPEGDVVRFDTNTSPWPGVALSDVGALALNEYPDTSYSMLTDALAAYTWAPADAITVGAGADEILDMLAKAFIGTGDPVVLSRPTYAMFRIVSEIAGGRVDAVPAKGLDLDRDRFLDASRHARLIWLCNANNPTGELLPVSFIEKLPPGRRRRGCRVLAPPPWPRGTSLSQRLATGGIRSHHREERGRECPPRRGALPSETECRLSVPHPSSGGRRRPTCRCGSTSMEAAPPRSPPACRFSTTCCARWPCMPASIWRCGRMATWRLMRTTRSRTSPWCWANRWRKRWAIGPASPASAMPS